MCHLRKLSLLITSFIMTVYLTHAQKTNQQLPNGWGVHDPNRPLPKKVSPGETNIDAPSDAIILFDGKNFDQWTSCTKTPITWKLNDNYMEVFPQSGNIYSKQAFGNIQLHIEWFVPKNSVKKGQKKGISGIFFMGLYKLQIIDALENKAYADGTVGAIYGQTPALVNAAKDAGNWQYYDIIFRAPVFKKKKLVRPAFITVFLNGVLIHNNTEIYGPAAYKKTVPYKAHEKKLSLMLQDHGQPVRYRNIWIRELD